VHALNDVAPYDWARLLNERVKSTNPHAPLGGIEGDGWKLIYNDQPNAFLKAIEKVSKSADLAYSLGITISKEGTLEDVIVGSPAYQSGLGPGMKLVAVNGRKWTPELLHSALQEAQGTSHNIELLVENEQFFKTYSIPYHDGEKNPHLERVADRADLMGSLLKPLTR